MRDFEKEAREISEKAIVETGDEGDRGPSVFGVRFLDYSIHETWSDNEKRAHAEAMALRRMLSARILPALRAAEAAGFERGRDAAATLADQSHTMEEISGSPTGSLVALALSRVIRALRPDAGTP